MDRAIAREQSLARLLMTYIVTGLIFMLLPGTFLGVWNLIKISSREAAESIHQLGFRRMATPSCSVGWARSFWESGFTRYRSAKTETVCTLVRMAHVGTLGRRRDPPLVVEHLSVALAYCPAIIRCA